MNTNEVSIPEKIAIDTHIILETTEESIFGQIDKMLMKGNKVFILDKYVTKSIFMFDKDGHFLRKWTMGKGPDQFSSADDFYVNDNADTLIVLSGYKKKLLSYSTETGAFVKEKKSPEGAERFTINNGKIFYEMNPEYGYHLAIEQLEGELDKQVTLPVYKSKITPLMFGFRHQDTTITRLFPCDTVIYEISKGIAKPKFTLQFGDKQAVINDTSILIGDKRGVIGLRHWATGDYMVITYTVDRKSFYDIYNTSTGETYSNVLDESTLTGNDIILSFLGRISATVGNQLVVSVEANTIAQIKPILKFIGEDKLSEKTKANFHKLVEISPKVESSDNPVLLFLNIEL